MTLSLPRYSHFFAALSLTTSALFALSGCNNTTTSTGSNIVKQTTATITPAVQAVVGDYASKGYASEGYAKRTQGYDWVGVMVRAADDEQEGQIDIKVRARSDIKKPSCYFDGKATFMGQDDAHGIIFQSKVNDSTAFFQFKDDKLTIDSQDKYALNYFCSGGGSLVGEYEKLAGTLKLN
ncbi:hypothetical protein [Psychrobacter sp. DAB_AL32B]|uniref:hypothetical protein n=1 Tax=Psychrobacter sp. DAB_AL32B TaxID=1028414 RepID=UPI000B7E2B73|nr:hypothetical protein [Psychrobacter sp. DAB_AL32B]OXL24920.1 hypothetical protein CAN34_04975 [Psychrobacter sp. DAB_AL32B]